MPKIDDINGLKVVLTPFKYPQLTVPRGFLPDDMRAQACWYYYTLAESALSRIGHSTENQFALLEGNLWMDLRYRDQALAVAKLYGLESPTEMFKFWEYVKEQAAHLNLPEPKEEYMHPKRSLIT